jgi:hypothetical protein
MFHLLDPALWVCPSSHRVMGLHARRQIIVARLPGGDLWVHSPAVVEPALRAALAELGTVRHVIGPNRWHDQCLAEFQTAYPEAEFYGAPGLAKSCRKVRFQHTLSDEPPPAWAGEFDEHLVRGACRDSMKSSSSTAARAV